MVKILTLVVHGHFYQPPRENPWTEEVPREPSAAPFHDWNERIAAESLPAQRLRPHRRRARAGSSAIVNNYEHLSLQRRADADVVARPRTSPTCTSRIVEADARFGGAIAQAYNHLILPLATERDVRTQVRWGLADFAPPLRPPRRRACGCRRRR